MMNSTDNYSGYSGRQIAAMHNAKGAVSKQAKHISAWIAGYSSSLSVSDLAGSLQGSIAADGTDLSVPDAVQQGIEMLKVSDKKEKRVVFKLNPDAGIISYQSSKRGVVPIETIKEIRTGQSTEYDRQRFRKPEEWLYRWMTIIYIIDGSYKMLHMVADTEDVLNQWHASLRKLYAIRQGLMVGLGQFDLRQTIWERQYWKGAGKDGNQLVFAEVLGLCKRLNVNLSCAELQKLFHAVDFEKRGFLDFQGFQRFVKILKYRPEIDAIYEGIKSEHERFDYAVFKKFMIETQKVSLPDSELQSIFLKYTHTTTLTDNRFITLDQFSSFLLSPDNAVLSEYGKGVWHDMTRPLSDYYLSSSHNTYLVGHQLVGVSTIEGYIRALLHSCRTVELDIYDGDNEPMIYHGRTFTSKVSLRDICQAINKYAFATSPYPVIISAELHLNVKQQDTMVDVMMEEFGDRLVMVPTERERLQLDKLPSPEQLRCKILLKAKNKDVIAELAERKARFNRQLERLSQQQQSTRHYEDTVSSLRALICSSSENSSSVDEGEGSNGGKGLRDELKDLKSKWKKIRSRRKKTNTTDNAIETPGQIASMSASPPAITSSHVPGQIPFPSLNISPSTTTSIPLESQPEIPLIEAKTNINVFSPSLSPDKIRSKGKLKMSPRLVSLLVYTIGVKCLGIGAHSGVVYSPEHVFSLSETSINRLIKTRASSRASMDSGTDIGGESSVGGGGEMGQGGLRELIKHTQKNLVRIYPKGSRVNSSNYEPYRYWATGAQVVAINWQTFDLGYKINQAMFRRNGNSGYVLKPLALRGEGEQLLGIYSKHFFDITIISAQQLPRLRDSSGQETMDDSAIDPFIEVTLHIPEWTTTSPPGLSTSNSMSPSRRISKRTKVIKNDFNPVWQESFSICFDCVGGVGKVGGGGMLDLVFVEISVRRHSDEEGEPVAIFCTPLSNIELGYRYLPLYDMQLTQYMFSTLFVKIGIRDHA